MSIVLFYDDKVCAFEDRVTFADVDGGHCAFAVCIDVVFHLHGFEDEQCLSFFDCITDLDFNVEYDSRQW